MALIYSTYLFFSCVTSLLFYWLGCKNLKRLPAFLYVGILLIVLLVGGYHCYLASHKDFLFFNHPDLKVSKPILIWALCFFLLNIHLGVRVTNRRDGE